ncbi:Neuropeptide receptor [Dirofilaria immitis]
MLLTLFAKSQMVRRGIQSRKSSMDDKIPVIRIATYTLLLCLFHLSVEHRTGHQHLLYHEIFPPPEYQMPSSSFIYFMYGVHVLPCINSASNFILYGLLNR